MYSSILIIMHSSLTEIVSASVAGQISSDSSNVVELIEVRSDRGGMVSMSRLSRILNINTKFTKLDAGTDADPGADITADECELQWHIQTQNQHHNAHT